MAIELPFFAHNITVSSAEHTIFIVRSGRDEFRFIETVVVQAVDIMRLYSVDQWPNPNAKHSVCVRLQPDRLSWYGGPAHMRQYWPMEKMHFQNYSYVPKLDDHAAVMERYWLNSAGGYIHIADHVPLFISQNVHEDRLCFVARVDEPYKGDQPNSISLSVGIATDARIAHRYVMKSVFGYPSSVPDAGMTKYPVWSTWARYKEQVNETAVLQLADEIERYGFEQSHIQIDDNWEECYGSLRFDPQKFPDIRNLTDRLRARGIRTTLWIHPFVNKECEADYEEGQKRG